MINDLKMDYRANNKGKKALMIMAIYRTGHKIHGADLPQFIKKPLLLIMKIIYEVFVLLPFHVDIPFACEIGAGFRIVHIQGIVINGSAKIGENCTIYHQTTIGINELSGNKQGAEIGNNVFIGCGAKIIGNVKIGDNAKIGANAVVVKDLKNNSTAICKQEVI